MIIQLRLYFGFTVGVWVQSGSGAVSCTAGQDGAMVMMQETKGV